jgi:hypothetical protein
MMTHRVKLLGLTLIAVFALGATASTLALASELPVFSVETKFTGTSGAGKFGVSEGEVKCKSATSSGTPSSTDAGTFTTDFKECSLISSQCHSLGDASGIILAGGEYRLVALKSEEEGIWFLLKELHIECASLSTLILLTGGVLGSITPTLSKTTKFEVKVDASGGKQEITEFEDGSGRKTGVWLDGSIDGGTIKSATEESAENKITTSSETEVKLAGPKVTVAPDEMDFHELIVAKDEIELETFTYTNDGPGGWKPGVGLIAQLPVAGNQGYDFVMGTCEGMIAEKATCKETIEFFPKQKGEYMGKLVFDFAPTVPLIGKGV